MKTYIHTYIPNVSFCFKRNGLHSRLQHTRRGFNSTWFMRKEGKVQHGNGESCTVAKDDLPAACNFMKGSVKSCPLQWHTHAGSLFGYRDRLLFPMPNFRFQIENLCNRLRLSFSTSASGQDPLELRYTIFSEMFLIVYLRDPRSSSLIRIQVPSKPSRQ